jgi:hypothetical protein
MTVFTNGKLPRSALKEFRNTGKFGHPVFIDHLEAAFKECERNGIFLSISSGQDILRDYTGQVYWRNYWCARGQCYNAATPGTSKHGLGICADITGNGTRGTSRWNLVARIFRKYKIEFNVSTESWHCQDMSIKTNGWYSVDVPKLPSAGTLVPGYSGNPYFPKTAAFAAVQGGYNALGYNLTKDGRVGPKTTAATRDFQRKNGLVVDGVHGPGTEKKLIEVVKKKRAEWAAKPKSISEVVKDQQRRLNVWRAATPPLVVDGVPGPKFVQAVKVFQRARGIKIDGKIGSQTWKLLQLRP